MYKKMNKQKGLNNLKGVIDELKIDGRFLIFFCVLCVFLSIASSLHKPKTSDDFQPIKGKWLVEDRVFIFDDGAKDPKTEFKIRFPKHTIITISDYIIVSKKEMK